MTRTRSAAMLLATLALTGSGASADPATSAAPAPRIEVHGHRGARAVRPENTLAGFRFAIEAGADAIELDVVATSDDRLVVHHDLQTNPDLCTGPDGRPVARVPLRTLPLARIRALDCGRANPRFPRQVAVPGERIPTLEEALDLIRTAGGGRVRIDVELKSAPVHPDWTPAPDRFAALVLAAIRASGLHDRVEVRSFDHRLLLAVRAADPTLLTAVLVDRCLPDLVAVARAAGATRVAPHHEWITADDVRRLHAAGMTVVPWTANDPADWARLVAAGVDGIVTDDPAGLAAFLGKDVLERRLPLWQESRVGNEK